MKIAIIVLITIVVIEQLSFGVNGCNTNKENTNMPAQDVVIAKGAFTYNKRDLIGQGLTAAVYQGKTTNGTKVAVKVFFKGAGNSESYAIELECYKKMGATIDDKCKIYGIPPIWFSGRVGGLRVLVMPRYFSTLKSLRENNFRVSVRVWISIMQQMVITIKFMHSKGVIHGDIHSESMMVELNEVYLIGYGFNLYKKKQEGNDMLKMFLAICSFFNLREFMEQILGLKIFSQKEQIIRELKTLNVINSKYAGPLVEFCIEAYYANVTNRLPNYDEMYGILDRALYPGGDHSKRIVFDWLSDEEKAAARKMPFVSIASIQFESPRRP